MAVPPIQKVTPLNWQVPIVNPDGTPSAQFIRLWQQLFGNGENSDDKVQQLIDAELQAGAGIAITPDGHLLSNPTISADLQAMLDAITSTQGSILYRSGSQWTYLGPGTSGYVLKTNGTAADPSWTAPPSGGGTWAVVDDFTISTAIASHAVNVASYDSLIMIFLDVTASASGSRGVRVSTDGGTTYFSTSGDYTLIPSSGVRVAQTQMTAHSTANAGARSGLVSLASLRNTTAPKVFQNSDTTDGIAGLFLASNAAVTNIQYLNSAGNMTGGRFITYGK